MIEARVDGLNREPPSVDQLQNWSPSRGLLWLNATPADSADVEYLSAGLRLHTLVVEDIHNRNQRPKVDDYDAYLFVVLFGAIRDSAGQLALAEVHIVLGDGWLVTISDTAIPALRQLAGACEKRPEIAGASAPMLFHRICDALVDSIFPILDEIDDEIERVENNIVARADEQTVRDIFRLKRDLTVLRRVLGPERDLLQLLAGPRTHRLDAEAQLYLRDVYDHAVRMVEQVDSYRDIITGALDVYLSSVSNRLGEQTRRLTLIATIFLPLTFLTGFFGMNFAVLVSAISTPRAFAVGLVAMVVSVCVVVIVSQRLTARVTPIPESTATTRRFSMRTPPRRKDAD
jgi:magnesium transporter